MNSSTLVQKLWNYCNVLREAKLRPLSSPLEVDAGAGMKDWLRRQLSLPAFTY
jgi:hypothetical protein